MQHDIDLSDDEGLMPDQPAFVGLFRPQLFRSLLHKAKITTRQGTVQANPGTAMSLLILQTSCLQNLP